MIVDNDYEDRDIYPDDEDFMLEDDYEDEEDYDEDYEAAW